MAAGDPSFENHCKGWPSRRALAAAVALHVAVLIAMLLPQQHTFSRSSIHALSVNLVFAPALPSADRGEATAAIIPPNDATDVLAGTEVANATADMATTIPDSDRIPLESATKPQHSSETTHAPVLPDRKAKKKRQVPAHVAIYDVLVDAAGNIRDVVLTRSSGVPSFDEAGKKMIYDGIALPPSTHDTNAVKVTLHFSRETP